MRREVRPSERYGTKFCVARTVPVKVIRRQKLPGSAARMQRQCSAAWVAYFAIASSIVAYDKFASGFNSRRLHSKGHLRFVASGLFLFGI